MAEESRSGLVNFIETLFKDWKVARQETEVRWEEDLSNFLAEDSRKWKKKDAGTEDPKDSWRSKVFVRMTKQKVVMSYSFLNDMIFQNGKLPFMFKPNKKSYQTPEDVAFAQYACEEMKKEVDSQLADCKADRHFMKGTFSMALYGECCLCSPAFDLVEKKHWQVSAAEGYEDDPEYQSYEKEVVSEEQPCVKYKSIWNIFPDPEYTDIQRGRGVIDRDMLSPFDLRKLKGRPGYDGDAIDSVISSNRSSSIGEESETLPPNLRDIQNANRTIKVLNFWGRVPKDYFEETPDIKASTPKNQFDLTIPEDMGDDIEVNVVIANSVIIRAVVNEDGRRPYHICRFEEILDEIHGIGMARNLQDAQLIVTGAYRNLIDNVALTGNVMGAVDEDSLAPGETMDFYPGKIFKTIGGTDVRKAFQQLRLDPAIAELLELIGLAERYGDEESQMPKIMQGDVAEKKKPDTLGEMNLLYQNAGKYLGQVMRNIDEELIEPIAEDFYDVNMMRPEMQHLHGDYTVHALGFSSFQTKVVKMTALKNFLGVLLLHEATIQEAKFRPILEEMGKALDLDPDQFLYTEEEKMQIQEMQKQARMEEMQMQIELGKAQVQAEADAEMQKAEHKAEIDDVMDDEKLERDLVKDDKKLRGDLAKGALKMHTEIAKVQAKPKPMNGGTKK